MTETRRITFFPYGQSADPKLRTACEAALIKCGADTQRIFDGPWRNEEHFITYASRLCSALDSSSPAIVALARSNPIKLHILGKRKLLCQSLPFLNRALWIIFIDPWVERRFFISATELGVFDGTPESDGEQTGLLVWMPNEEQRSCVNERYVVLTPHTRFDEYFHSRLSVLWDEIDRAPRAK